MKATELKKIIKVSIDDTCMVGELKTVKNNCELFKTDAINNLINACTEIICKRASTKGMKVSEYAEAEIVAYTETDYVLSILAFCETNDGVSLHKHYRRVYGCFSFRVEDGVITLSEVRQTITVY